MQKKNTGHAEFDRMDVLIAIAAMKFWEIS